MFPRPPLRLRPALLSAVSAATFCLPPAVADAARLSLGVNLIGRTEQSATRTITVNSACKVTHVRTQKLSDLELRASRLRAELSGRRGRGRGTAPSVVMGKALVTSTFTSEGVCPQAPPSTSCEQPFLLHGRAQAVAKRRGRQMHLSIRGFRPVDEADRPGNEDEDINECLVEVREDDFRLGAAIRTPGHRAATIRVSAQRHGQTPADTRHVTEEDGVPTEFRHAFDWSGQVRVGLR
jgi:hypothetical protein